MNLKEFDLPNVTPMQPRTSEPLPPGDYMVEIIEAKEMANKKTDGTHLSLTFRVMDGDYRRRQHWQRLNLKNSNPMAKEMAKAELASIAVAVGIPNPEDSSELCSIPLSITIAHKKRTDGTGGTDASIVAYRPAGEHPGDEAQAAAAFSAFSSNSKPAEKPAARSPVQPPIAPPRRPSWINNRQTAPPYQPVAAKTGDDMEAADIPF
jgi:hypothetical protein